MSMSHTETQAPHIAIVPTPGMGHLLPLLEFAKRLVHNHNFAITFIIPTDGSPTDAQKAVLDALSISINYIFLPPVSFDHFPEENRAFAIVCLTVGRSLPFLRDAFKYLLETTKIVALVVDVFGTDAFDVANQYHISPYLFYPSAATALSLSFYLPELDERVECEYRELVEPVRIPGCIPIHGRDFVDLLQDRKEDAYKWFLHHSKRYKLAEGIMVNTFVELEAGPIKTLQEQEPGKPCIYAIGPLVNIDSTTHAEEESECLKWLNNQPHASVLFVAFGSRATLSTQQTKELALGLEISEQNFLWALRTPNDKGAIASCSTVQTHKKQPLEYLPQGFLERTKGQGLVVPDWAPQAQVLSHCSTGGFLTHCGWNSTLESVVNGVPLIAWPLYAEQKMNAVLLTEDIKVALRPKAQENGIVGREEIARVVKGLMEGEEGKKIGYRMKELKEAAAKVLSEDGSSTMALSELARKWNNKNAN